MRKHGSRILVAAGILLSGAYLCAAGAGGTLGCGSFGADSALSAIDMCFIFDCTDGAIGGLIKPCDPVVGPDQGGGGDAGGGAGLGQEEELTFFADCPTEEEP
jgi:hypothetical protein